MQHYTKKKRGSNGANISCKPKPLFLVTISIITTTFLILHLSRRSPTSTTQCRDPPDTPFTEANAVIASEFENSSATMVSVLHYVTSSVVPQLSLPEIRKPYDILLSLAPCNLLIFGTGHDSLMWDSFNPRGTTLFLEEDPQWAFFTLRRFPVLRVKTVRFQTRLDAAAELLSSYKKDDHCWGNGNGNASTILGNKRCKLALSDMPKEVFERDWDVIMIDGPRGYYAAAPGRMAVIYSVSVMARSRRKSGVTHVFLHDADRKVERSYASEFLCMRYRVSEVGRLWHFVIPPALSFNHHDTSRSFCS